MKFGLNFGHYNLARANMFFIDLKNFTFTTTPTSTRQIINYGSGANVDIYASNHLNIQSALSQSITYKTVDGSDYAYFNATTKAYVKATAAAATTTITIPHSNFFALSGKAISSSDLIYLNQYPEDINRMADNKPTKGTYTFDYADVYAHYCGNQGVLGGATVTNIKDDTTATISNYTTAIHSLDNANYGPSNALYNRDSTGRFLSMADGVLTGGTSRTAILPFTTPKTFTIKKDVEQIKGYETSVLVKYSDTTSDIMMEGGYNIGEVGTLGFGVGILPDALLPTGWTKLPGHSDVSSDNYGNVTDTTGSVMVYIPKFYFHWNTDNTLFISPTQIPEGYALFASEFVIHRAFIDNGKEVAGVCVDKYGCGNVGGIFKSIQGIDPASTNSAHNPISALNNSPANNYGGLYKAVKTRSQDHFLTSIFIYNALAMLAYAQGKSAINCAFADVAPYLPKGNNNNALKDYNDSSVSFTGSGYSNCALTGSGVPFAKTTHNGQNCGVADLNGNMWEVASGFIKYGASDAIFKLLKESVRLADIPDDNTTTASGGAYDTNLYDNIDLTRSMSSDATSRFGNGSNQIFAMNTDRTTEQYKMTTAGLPMIGGYSYAGTIEFGQDYYRQYWRDQMAPVVGGWNYTSYAGVFSLSVHGYRTYSGDSVGGRTSRYIEEPE